MEFKNIIDNRYSSRSFSDKQVSLDVLKQIISDAQTTASWVNSQPWKVYIATGEKLTAIKKKHLELIAAGRPSSPVFPVLGRNLWHQDQQENMAAWSQEKEDFQHLPDKIFRQLNETLFSAPAIIYFAIPKNSPDWSKFDIGAFVQTATLSAINQGLNTMIAYEFVKFPEVLAEDLTVDEDYQIVIGIAVGYEDDHIANNFRSSRRPLDDILTIFE